MNSSAQPGADQATLSVPSRAVLDTLGCRIGQAALALAERGFRVFPCEPGGKRPAVNSWPAVASMDREQIKQWWQRNPKVNVGCPMGRAAGIWCLDVDLPDGPRTLADLEAAHSPLPATLEQRTGGGGRHLFFRYPEGREVRNNVRTKLGPGLDVRGEGGYVVLPPSVHPSGGGYAWVTPLGTEPAEAPEWLMDMVCANPDKLKGAERHSAMPEVNGTLLDLASASTTPSLREPAPLAVDDHNGTPVRSAWAQAALEYEVIGVAEAQPGTRNDTLNKAAFNLGQLVGGGALPRHEVEETLRGAGRACGLEDEEIVPTIASGLAAGMPHPRNAPAPRGAAPNDIASVHGAVEEGRDTRPVLLIREGEMHILADQAEQALLAAGEPIYQRGGQLVRVVRLDLPLEMDGTSREQGTVILKAVDGPWLTDRLARAARFAKLRKGGDAAPANPPAQTAQVLISRAGAWKFKALRGLLACPGLRAGGGLVSSVGYDEASGFYLTDAVALHVPMQPTRQEAERALGALDGLLCEFPFATPVDKSVAMAMLLTPFVRACCGKVPLFVISAPTRGTGKSTLVRVMATLATGRGAPVLAATSSGEELEKRLTSALLAGDTMVLLDNYNGVLRSNLLSQAVTEGVMNVRPLGVSDPVQVDASGVLWIANGNGISVAGDLTRRALKCTLDAGLERPEGRQFKGNPEQAAREHRTELVTAVLALLRAYHAAGCPGASVLPQWAGFDVWSKAVRGPLVWLGLPDPYESAAELVEDDPERELLLELLTAWHELFGERRLSVKELAGYAGQETQAKLLPVLREISGDGAPTIEVNPRKVGRWLKANAGRIVGGLRLTRAGAERDGALWCVKKAS